MLPVRWQKRESVNVPETPLRDIVPTRSNFLARPAHRGFRSPRFWVVGNRRLVSFATRTICPVKPGFLRKFVGNLSRSCGEDGSFDDLPHAMPFERSEVT